MSVCALVADADATNIELISAVLLRCGFTVTTALTTDEAMTRAVERSPALCVCAADLPGGPVSELVRRLRERLPATRTVVVHSEQLDEDARAALRDESGCDRLLESPFRLHLVRSELAAWGLLEDETPAPEPAFSYFVPVQEPPLPLELAPAEASVGAEPPPSLVGLAPLPVPMPTLPLPALPLAAEPPSPPEPALPELDLDELAIPAALEPAPPEPPEPEPAPSEPVSELAALPELNLEELVVAAPAPAPEPEPASELGPEPARVPQPITLPPSLAPVGQLTVVPLPRLLYELYVVTFSGSVELTHARGKATIYVWGGLVVHVDLGAETKPLGALLEEHGRITTAERAALDREMERCRCRAGRALRTLKLLSDADLLGALREHTADKLVSLFAWRDGAYRLDMETAFADDILFSEVHPLQIVWRGVAEHYDVDSLLRFFSPLEKRYLVATPQLAVHYEAVGSLLREIDIVRALDGKTTVHTVLVNALEQTAAVARGLYGLLVTDMIRLQAKPGPAAVLPMEPVAPPPAAARPVDYRLVAAACEEVASAYLRIKDTDYFTLLGVKPGAGAAEVAAAYARVVEPFEPQRLPAGLPEDVLRRAREIVTLVGRARDILSDPSRAVEYLSTNALWRS